MLRHDISSASSRRCGARVRMLEGAKLTFDEESQALYDAVAPTILTRISRRSLEEIDRALPGAGPARRSLRGVPAGVRHPARPARRASSTARSPNAARRTLPHVQLPANESFTVEYVTNKPWSGYNWYQGNYRSLIQVNTDLPIYIDRAIDLACHEGYPGHHVYNVLLEKHLVRERGWVEFSVYALFSPQSLIAEGTANYGIEVAFPGDERLAFERDVLFPAAGLDASRPPPTRRCARSSIGSSYAGNEAARTVSERRDRRARSGRVADALRADAGGARPSSERASSTPTAATSSTTTSERTW